MVHGTNMDKLRRYVLSTRTHISTRLYGVTSWKEALPVVSFVRALRITGWSVASSAASLDS
jgi:hypothetical protein